ncbi:MAG: porin [Candidatus Kapaibacterium sp.]
MLRIATILCLFLVGTSMYAQGVSYPSFGKGINIMADDSSASMKVNVRIQNLFEAGYDDFLQKTNTKFMVRRQRLKFSGHVVDKDLRYKLELGFSNRDQGNSRTGQFGSDGSNIVLDAVVKYYLFEDFDIWFGQTKLPGNRERVISSGDMQFVDRSLLNSNLNIDRDAGIQIRYKFGTDFVVKPTFAFTTGEGRNITADNAGGFAYTFHTDILPFGDFDDYVSSDHSFNENHKLAIGAAFSFNDATDRQGGQIGNFVFDTAGGVVHNDMFAYFADLHYKYNGISIMAEVARKNVDKELNNITKKFITGDAVNFQIGYLFRNYWELAARYSYVKPDNSFSDIDELAEYTFGISKYLSKHKLKIQSDLSYFDNFGLAGEDDFRYRFQIELQL